MYRSSSGRSSLPSSSRSKESSSSGSRSSRPGASTSGSTRGRSPRRSRSPSPRGRRHRSPSSSRSSRRSPSARRASRVRSPSGGSRSRRGSEQRDGSLSRRHSPERHSCSSRRHPRFLGSCSPRRRSESMVEQSLWTEFNSDFHSIDPRERRRLSDRLGSPDSLSDVDRSYLDDDDTVFIRSLSCSRSLERYHSHQESPPSSFSTRYDKDYCGRDAFLHQSDYNMNDDRLEDLPRESDKDGHLFPKYLHPSEEERLDPKHPRYDREDRLLDASTDFQSSLSEKRNYYRRRLSISQMHPDEDFRKLLSSRRKREEEELSKNMYQDCPGSDYVIRGLTNSLQSSESWYLYRPDEAPAMPQKPILRKWVDDPTMQPSEQNFGSIFRKKEHQESISESADLRDDFFLPLERASQDRSGVSHVLDRMADSASTQEQRRHSFLDAEDEYKFLYGDDEDGSNINCPTEKLTVNGEKASVSLNKRPLSPIQSGIEYEKIHDLLKTIGLDIGVAEIGKGAARTQERLHGKKRLCSLDGPAHKADSSDKGSFQSNTPSSRSDQKTSLSPCGSSQPSKDVSSASISEHAKSKTLEYDNSTGAPEQSFPSVSITPSAPPSLPILPFPPPVSQYSLSHFSAFLAAQVRQNNPPSAMAPPSYQAFRPFMAYSAPAWPMYIPPHQSNPSLPNVRWPASVIMSPKPTRSNLRIIETVSTVKENPEIKPVITPPKPTRPNLRVIKTVKENPEIKRNKSVLVKVPITPTNSKLLSRSSSSGTTEKTSDGKNQTSEKPQECLNKNPLCDERRNLNLQAGLTLIQETECGLKRIHCEKEKEARDEENTEVARKEELGEKGNENEISEGKEDSYAQKLMITLALKKDEKEGEKGESQKESGQSSSEKCSLRRTETNNQSKDQDGAAPKVAYTEEGECRKSKSQSGSPDATQKVTVLMTQNLGMKTKEQKIARVAKVQQHSKSSESPHCPPLLTLPPGSPLSLFPFPGSRLSYNMYIPPFSDSLLFALHRATEERKQKKQL